MKVILKNFQAIEYAEFEFPEGQITVIQGPTNSGKTAVFRAIQTLLLNPVDAPSFIREGAAEGLTVILDKKGLPPIEYHRTLSKGWYVIDGKKYSKLGRNTLYDILPEMQKHFLYDSADPRELLNFQTEDEQAFPFDCSAMEMFKRFEKVFKISDTKSILDTIKKEENEVSFAINQNRYDKEELTKNVEQLKSCIKLIDPLSLSTRVSVCKKAYSAIQKVSKIIQDIKTYAPIIASAANMVAFKDTKEIDSSISEYRKLKETLDNCKTAQNFLENYTDIHLSELSETTYKEYSALNSKKTEIESNLKWLETSNLKIAEYGKKLEEIDSALALYTVCPLCGQELEK